MINNKMKTIWKDSYSESFKLMQDKKEVYKIAKLAFKKKTPFYLKKADDVNFYLLLSRARNLTYGEEIHIEFGGLEPGITNIAITSIDLADIADKYFLGGFWCSLFGQGYKKHKKNVLKVYDTILSELKGNR